SVSLNGSGSGTVNSSPAGINCGPVCAANYANASTVTLTATPSAGSTFAGWSGAGCSGTDTCTVLMSAAQAVTATFTPIPPAVPTSPVTAIAPVVPTAARVSSASVSNRVFADSASPNLVSTAGQRRRVGTTIRYTLDKSASVRFDFTQPGVGRDVKGKCVAQNRLNQRKGKCARTLVRGSLTFAGHTGQNTVKFDGWLSKHKRLKPGKYTLVITA